MADRQHTGPELRRTEREEGLQLLFGAAMDVARQQGKLQEGQAPPSFDHSQLERGRYKLRDRNDRLLTMVPLAEARLMLAHRRHVIRAVLDQLNVSVNSHNTSSQERQKLRLLKEEIRALAWATGTGRRIPQPPHRRLELLVSIVLLLCGVIPGVIYIYRGQMQRRRYQGELKALSRRWREAGKPEPPDSFFSLYHH